MISFISSRAIKAQAIVLSLLLVGSLYASLVQPEPTAVDQLDSEKLQLRIYSAVETITPAVVAINDGGSIFSGVIVGEDGLILSAGHAVTPYRSYTVMLADGREFRAKGLGVNRRVDMAMLRIQEPKNLPVAELGSSAGIVKHQPCVGVSHPGLYDATRGSVVRFGYVKKPVTINEGMIETTAMMEPGDSGGPLIDLDGRVIGIHSNIRQDATLNYDVPIDSFKKHWEELLKPKRFEIAGWPSLPTLGFRAAPEKRGKTQFVVESVKDGGLAAQAGLLVNDVITELAGMRVDTQKQFRDRFIKQRLKREPEMELVVLRQGKPVVLVVQLGEKNLPKPDSYSELATFADQFSSLESILDDVEHVVHSKVEGKPLEVRALRIQRSGDGLVVTKSSRVGEQPKIELSNGKRITATVVARDAKNDLVLLRARFPSVGGLDLSNVSNELSEKRGRLLLVPDSKGKGRVSIWGSKFIDVPRTRASAGYLGVQVGSSRNDVVFAQVMQGAAKKAGFKSGDVILKMDDTVVSRTKDVFDFLQDKDAYSKINIQIRRDETELTKEVILGARPMNETGHVADDLKGGKSLRRDGFSLVMSHDADLGAAECGGPVFDISGDFLGLNIARYSRTRCYVLPRTIVKAFVDANAR